MFLVESNSITFDAIIPDFGNVLHAIQNGKASVMIGKRLHFLLALFIKDENSY